MKCSTCKFNGYCNTTSELYGVPKYNGGCQYYKERKKQTNADRIRSMSDEELAELLIRQYACEHCEYHGNNTTCKAPSEFTCTNLYAEGITLRWLKSEVKE